MNEYLIASKVNYFFVSFQHSALSTVQMQTSFTNIDTTLTMLLILQQSDIPTPQTLPSFPLLSQCLSTPSSLSSRISHLKLTAHGLPTIDLQQILRTATHGHDTVSLGAKHDLITLLAHRPLETHVRATTGTHAHIHHMPLLLHMHGDIHPQVQRRRRRPVLVFPQPSATKLQSCCGRKRQQRIAAVISTVLMVVVRPGDLGFGGELAVAVDIAGSDQRVVHPGRRVARQRKDGLAVVGGQRVVDQGRQVVRRGARVGEGQVMREGERAGAGAIGGGGGGTGVVTAGGKAPEVDDLGAVSVDDVDGLASGQWHGDAAARWDRVLLVQGKGRFECHGAVAGRCECELDCAMYERRRGYSRAAELA